MVHNNYMCEEESNLEEKRGKIKVLEDLDSKIQEVEALKQQTANHANEMELLHKEAIEREE